MMDRGKQQIVETHVQNVFVVVRVQTGEGKDVV